MIEFIFFDFANTLVYKPGLYDVIQRIIETRLNQKLEYSTIKKAHLKLTELMKLPDKPERDFYDQFNKQLLNNLSIKDFDNSILEEIYLKLKSRDWEAFPDIKFLEDIKLPKGILSNWDGSLKFQVKNLTGMFFDPILGSADSGVSKPDLEFYKFAIESVNYPSSNILMIGDSLSLDILPAKALGMESILIDRHGDYVDGIAGHYDGIIIKSLEELPRLIKEL
jgi:putative hydrolase of the HAD superfamily